MFGPSLTSSVIWQQLIDALGDPLVLLNLAGNVTHANPAAKAAWGRSLPDLERQPPLLEAIKWTALGKGANHRIELDDKSGSGTTQATLCGLPNDTTNFLLVLPGRPDEAQTAAVHTFLDLVRGQLVAPLTAIADGLKVRELPHEQREALRALSTGTSEKISKLLDLIEVFGPDALVADDRFLATELINDALGFVRERAERSLVKLFFDPKRMPDVPIYGSRRWLRRALVECLDNAIKFASKEVNPGVKAHVEIRGESFGTHLTLHITNHGAAPLHLTTDEIRPFKTPSQLPPERLHEPSDSMKLGLALAKRIIEMHQGHMRLNQTDEALTEVLLELPIGAPGNADSSQGLEQAQRYAEDLAQLIASTRRLARNRP